MENKLLPGRNYLVDTSSSVPKSLLGNDKVAVDKEEFKQTINFMGFNPDPEDTESFPHGQFWIISKKGYEYIKDFFKSDPSHPVALFEKVQFNKKKETSQRAIEEQKVKKEAKKKKQAYEKPSNKPSNKKKAK